MSEDAKARLTLLDGRVVWRDGRGRYRDEANGQWVGAEAIKALLPSPETVQLSEKPKNVRQHVLDAVEGAVRRQGYAVKDSAEAFGTVMGVQAEIALDKENGARATSAARLVAQATG